VIRTDLGYEVVAVKRKPLLKNVPGLGVTEADVYTLRWNGTSMEENKVLDSVSGGAADYWVKGRELFIVARADLLMLLGHAAEGDIQSSTILYYFKFDPVDNGQ
jgi:hypothetical protein